MKINIPIQYIVVMLDTLIKPTTPPLKAVRNSLEKKKPVKKIKEPQFIYK
jgi:hypothetical protein